jgi:hypothetical protein
VAYVNLSLVFRTFFTADFAARHSRRPHIAAAGRTAERTVGSTEKKKMKKTIDIAT